MFSDPNRLVAPLCVLICAALATWCVAQPAADDASPPAAEPAATHHWRGELTMWIWLFGIEGDIGGFGVESDLTWSATAALAFDFTLFNHPASILAGYRAIGHDFSEGSGADEFTWDARESASALLDCVVDVVGVPLRHPGMRLPLPGGEIATSGGPFACSVVAMAISAGNLATSEGAMAK